MQLKKKKMLRRGGGSPGKRGVEETGPSASELGAPPQGAAVVADVGSVGASDVLLRLFPASESVGGGGSGSDEALVAKVGELRRLYAASEGGCGGSETLMSELADLRAALESRIAALRAAGVSTPPDSDADDLTSTD